MKFIKIFFKQDLSFYFNIVILIFILVLPFLLFGTKLHIEGDDSHLYYDFPELWIKNIANSSWMSFSSVGNQDQHFFFLPILYFFWFLKILRIPTYIIQNLSFSSIFILGFIFFKKIIVELIPTKKEDREIILVGSLLYIFSPILLLAPIRSYLAPIWLIGVIPTLCFLFIRYLKSNKPKYLIYTFLVSVIFSFALNGIPWILGFLLPIGLSLVITSFVFNKKEILNFIIKITVFIFIIFLSQAFWFIPFVASLFGTDSLGSKVLGSDVKESFTQIVNATDTGNTIIDPLLNLFHRQLQINFNWVSNNSYLNWYDLFIPLDFLYPIVIFIGLSLSITKKSRVFTLVFLSFLISLFLFTVRVGVFENIFLQAGNIPGFAMFRNFFDKFALGYTFLFSITFSICLIYCTANQKIGKLRYLLLFFILLTIGINTKPFVSGEILNAPLQNTTSVYPNINIPNEYLSFMKEVRNKIPIESNIFDVPFGTSAYSIFKGENSSSNVFSGKSPVKLFSDINDFSGTLSFPTDIANQINSYLVNRNYVQLKHIFSELHINYIVETKNIPQQLLSSSLYNQEILGNFDIGFKKNMYGKLIFQSDNNNYALYAINFNGISAPEENFVIAQNTYSVNPLFFKNNDQVLPGTLSYMLDAKNISLPSNAFKNIKPTGIISSIVGDSSINKINSNNVIFIPHDDLYKLNFIKNTLVLKNIAQSIFSNTPDIIIPLKSLSTSTVFKINNNYYTSDKLINVVISLNDTIEVFQKNSNNLLEDTTKIFQSWSHGDCFARDSKPSVYFNQIGSSTISLKSDDGHDACIYNQISTNLNNIYLLNFNFKPSQNNINTSIIYDNGTNISNQYKAVSDQWNNYKSFFIGSLGKISLYLYSGKNEVTSNTLFQNINLYSYSHLNSINLNTYIQNNTNHYYKFNDAKIPAITDTSKTEQVFLSLLSNWNQADCASIDNNPSTFFNNINEDNHTGISIESKNNHDACIYTTLNVDPNYEYLFSFDYYSVGAEDDFTVTNAFSPKLPSSVNTSPRILNKWYSFSETLLPSEVANQLTLYLYSGKSLNGISLTKYRNINLVKIPKTFSENVLITNLSKSSSSTVPQIVSHEYAPHSYEIKISNAKEKFFINFLQPFHNGWKIYSTTGKYEWYKYIFSPPINFNHYPVNNFSNGWLIDVNTYCKNSNFCKSNNDGSYNIDLTVEFWPQRWFYVGLIISGTTLAAILGYLGYDVIRRIRNRKKNKSKKIEVWSVEEES